MSEVNDAFLCGLFALAPAIKNPVLALVLLQWVLCATNACLCEFAPQSPRTQRFSILHLLKTVLS